MSVWFPGPQWQPKVQQIHVGAEGNTRAVVELQPPAPLMAPVTPPRVLAADFPTVAAARHALGCERQGLGFANRVALQEVDAHAPRGINRRVIFHLLGNHLEVQ